MFRPIEFVDYEKVLFLIRKKRDEVLNDLKTYPKRIKFGLLSNEVCESAIGSTVDGYNYAKVKDDCETYFDSILDVLTVEYFQSLVDKQEGFVCEVDGCIVGFIQIEKETAIGGVSNIFIIDTDYKFYWETFIKNARDYILKRENVNSIAVYLPAVSVLWQEPYLETFKLMGFVVSSTEKLNDIYSFRVSYCEVLYGKGV